LLSLDQDGFGDYKRPELTAQVAAEYPPKTNKLVRCDPAEPKLTVERGSDLHRRDPGNQERVPR
jgi:hypothetical protein